jgi:hypothetical protein
MTAFLRKLQTLFHREPFNRELNEELSFHREQIEQELRNDGMTSEGASLAARRRVGNESRVREETHDVLGFTLESVARDLRYASASFARIQVSPSRLLLSSRLESGLSRRSSAR